MAIQHNEEEVNIVSSLTILQQPEQVTTTSLKDAKKQQHYLTSIDSTMVIRQLPSEGLSFQLWPAATTLVNFFDHHQQPENKPLSPILSPLSDNQHRRLCILELGSGTGLVGIAAAALFGATVTLTDLPHVLPNLQFNADANSNTLALHGGTVNVASLRWGEIEDMETMGRDFDLILASDVVYYDHLFDPLLQTIRFFLNGDRKTIFVMAHLKRWKKDSVFFRKARKFFDVEMIRTDPPFPGSRIGVNVYRFRSKASGWGKS